MNSMKENTQATLRFERDSFAALQEAKKIAQQISPQVLEIPANLTQMNGMFGWFKVMPQADFQKSKINFINGKHFGNEQMVRMNLAFSAQKMQEIVNRLNGVLP
jgi:hypothetical protein